MNLRQFSLLSLIATSRQGREICDKVWDGRHELCTIYVPQFQPFISSSLLATTSQILDTTRLPNPLLFLHVGLHQRTHQSQPLSALQAFHLPSLPLSFWRRKAIFSVLRLSSRGEWVCS